MNRSTPFSLKKPQVLKGGPRHPVLIAVQPTEPAEQHTAPQPLPLRGQQQQRARAAETARAMPPSFPPGVVNSSSSSTFTCKLISDLLRCQQSHHLAGLVHLRAILLASLLAFRSDEAHGLDQPHATSRGGGQSRRVSAEISSSLDELRGAAGPSR